jgi:hypothetical protein
MIKKQVSKSIQASYQGSTHTNVDTSALVWRIATKARDLKLQTKTPNRKDNKTVKHIIDLQACGFKKFESSALAAFNKKIALIKQGKEIPVEEDEITTCPIVGHTMDTDNIENYGELTVLHE